MDYSFEDALQVAIELVGESENIDAATGRLTRLLDAYRERRFCERFEEIKRDLGLWKL